MLTLCMTTGTVVPDLPLLEVSYCAKQRIYKVTTNLKSKQLLLFAFAWSNGRTLQRQNVVTFHLKSKQLLLFAFVRKSLILGCQRQTAVAATW